MAEQCSSPSRTVVVAGPAPRRLHSSGSKAGRLRPEQTVALGVGALLLASGLLHMIWWLVEGSSLSGPISLRKPILFGISAGMTVVSLGWLMGKMQRRKGDFLLVSSLSLAMLVEVGLITIQQWRGVASHFNRETPLDAVVLDGIEWLILFATIVICELTRRSFFRLDARADMVLAIRGGMVLLVLSCLLGFVLTSYGNYQVSVGRSPEIFGSAGVMKFPHGVPMHAIQALPLLAWLLAQVGVPERFRWRATACALASIVIFTAFSLVQTLTGRARFDFTFASSVLLWIALICGGMTLWYGLLPLYVRLTKSRDSRPLTKR
ncbi:hypothetical protein [Lignipirellula cremea]|uniref:Uncharacterized protein n=1 Tax=Lignipirellula cremea TaxID=2528010 RepID=A0A518DKV9_9BACT|nr:hypothetical protein [Lignipirellula cremea]QDU92467.1 hypothetical protein Pla8534_02150 [Lignipirellula cremea]